MPRRTASLLAALVAAAVVAPAGLGLDTADAAPATSTAVAVATVDEGSNEPLGVDIDSITPGVIPRRGPIRISGTVTNLDTETWTTINLYAFVSATPMTTQDQLADALATPTDVSVGERIADDPTAKDTIEEIAPGDSAPFSFEVPRDRIPVTEAGVYWFGVHALGQGPEGRDDTADGRARTFIPLVPRRTAPLQASIAIPLRRQISYAADGSLLDVAGWTKALDTGGRLRSMVDLGVSAGSRAVTYVVDPALVDAVEQLAAGNRPRSLDPTTDAPSDEAGDDPGEGAGDGPTDGATDDSGTSEGSAAPSGSPGAGADDEGGEGDEGAGQEPALDAAAQRVQALAVDWLSRLGRALPGHQVLGLPYGDLDVAAAADHSPRTYTAARKRTGTELAPFGVPLDPVVASPGGYLDADALAMLEPGETVLVTDAMFTSPAGGAADDGAATTDPDVSADPVVPTVATDGGHRIVVTSTASTSGPGPGDPRSPLSVRQETLAQAAVRALSANPQPLAVVLPSDWNPVTASSFFSGFDVDWLDLAPVSAVESTTPTPVSLADLTYPRTQTRTEMSIASFATADDLVRAGGQLQKLLTRNDVVGGTIHDQALTSLSYTSRSTQPMARAMTSASTRWVQDQLAKVHIEAPRAVTMTGTSGRFSATVVNDLDQPVTVGLTAEVSEGIEISRPDKVRVAAATEEPGRARVLLTAKAPTSGVHTVTIGLADTAGEPVGDTDDLTIRSLQVSGVIWIFLAAAGALLFGAIAFRLVKRIRAARRTTAGPPPAPPGQAGSAEGPRPVGPPRVGAGA